MRAFALSVNLQFDCSCFQRGASANSVEQWKKERIDHLQLTGCLELNADTTINNDNCDALQLETARRHASRSKLFCVLAMSAPDERVFSQRWPHSETVRGEDDVQALRNACFHY